LQKMEISWFWTVVENFIREQILKNHLHSIGQ
jgi:hypothetical protein